MTKQKLTMLALAAAGIMSINAVSAMIQGPGDSDKNEFGKRERSENPKPTSLMRVPTEIITTVIADFLSFANRVALVKTSQLLYKIFANSIVHVIARYPLAHVNGYEQETFSRTVLQAIREGDDSGMKILIDYGCKRPAVNAKATNRSINLSKTKATNGCLVSLADTVNKDDQFNVNHIDLSSTTIDDTCFQQFQEYSKVGNKPTKKNILRIHHFLINITILNLSFTNITDKSLEILPMFKGLETLTLTGTKVTDEGITLLQGEMRRLNRRLNIIR